MRQARFNILEGKNILNSIMGKTVQETDWDILWLLTAYDWRNTK